METHISWLRLNVNVYDLCYFILQIKMKKQMLTFILSEKNGKLTCGRNF